MNDKKFAAQMREYEKKVDSAEDTLKTMIHNGYVTPSEIVEYRKVINRIRDLIHRVRLRGFSFDAQKELDGAAVWVDLLHRELFICSLKF